MQAREGNSHQYQIPQELGRDSGIQKAINFRDKRISASLFQANICRRQINDNQLVSIYE